MLKKSFLIVAFSIFLNAHGVFYEINNEAISIQVSSANNIAMSNAQVTIYAPKASLPFTKGKSDINGNFAFVPDSYGKWRVNIDVPSDHGSHKKEFTIEIDEKFNIKSFEKMPLERYTKILNALGILLGIFGIIVLFKCRKKKQ